MNLILTLCLLAGSGMAQELRGGIAPQVASLPIEYGIVRALHLGVNFTTSIRLPEEITSIVIGNPASFKAEHSEAEPRLAFFKPITAQPAESNALITTKSGQEISLYLISDGKAPVNEEVDFFVDYLQPRSLLVDAAARGLVVAERLVSAPAAGNPATVFKNQDPVATELAKQRESSSAIWHGKELRVAIGDPVQSNHRTILGFSILNQSRRIIELLPPQMELSGGRVKGSTRIKAEPVAVSEYRLTARQLAPGERANGVVVFERPTFKESSEQLQLQVAEAAQVDRPTLVSVPFISSNHGGMQ